jgi:hypothetical protein
MARPNMKSCLVLGSRASTGARNGWRAEQFTVLKGRILPLAMNVNAKRRTAGQGGSSSAGAVLQVPATPTTIKKAASTSRGWSSHRTRYPPGRINSSVSCRIAATILTGISGSRLRRYTAISLLPLNPSFGGAANAPTESRQASATRCAYTAQTQGHSIHSTWSVPT